MPQVWELVHRVLGYGAILLAVAAILTGLAKLTPKASTAVVGLYIAWAVLTAIAFIALEVRDPAAAAHSASQLARSIADVTVARVHNGFPFPPPLSST